MRTVRQINQLTGVSVRTLHHYDAIGLLKPSAITQAGYRLYDDEALRRLQTILLFRKLQFPLKDIKRILEHPEFDRTEVLRQQLKLLQLQRDETDQLILLARNMLRNEMKEMSFTPFESKELQEYASEVKARWGTTRAYQESQQRSAASMNDAAAGLMEIFARFGAMKDGEPISPEAQALVKELQEYITAHFYTCTKEILAGLGTMYTEDERFRANIDRSGGDGTAAFAAQAIAVYCS